MRKSFRILFGVEGRPELALTVPVGAETMDDAIELGHNYFLALNPTVSRRHITFMAREV